MEPQEWEPCNYQLADWSMEHAVWIPDDPVLCESESTEMACLELEETFVASSSRGQQLVQYAAAATRKYDDAYAKCVFDRKAVELRDDNAQWREKMHRYPASIRELGERYTVPTVVSIGPYHHGLDHLKKTEEAKYAAACSCIEHSKYSVQEMYDAVVSVAGKARSLYDEDVMAGIHHEKDFCPMMFYDACFLVQFMIKNTSPNMVHPWLLTFFVSNKDDIYHDILLLENQLPRVVIEIFELFMPVNLKYYAKCIRYILQNSRDEETKSSDIHDSTSSLYKVPHLLGYVRLFIIGTSKFEMHEEEKETKMRSFSVSAIELAQMRITLAPSQTPELAHMVFKEGQWPLSGKLSLPHIYLTYLRASILVNMAAFETTSKRRLGEDTAVCSYVQLLGMLMAREEDVQELRSKRIIQGGGLTNKETLDFFTTLRVPRGPLYHDTIRDVEVYKQNRRSRIKAYAFCYKYKKWMFAVLSLIATLSGIYGALGKR